MNTRPARPALRMFGGKWDLAPWVISHFPPHRHYVEPCFGGGSVLLQKPMVTVETANDLNGRVTNYFTQLRDNSAALIRALDLTPWSQDEYRLSKSIASDPVEDARRFHILCWMSINGGPVPTGFRTVNSIDSRGSSPATDLLNHDLWTVARRLKNIQITNVKAEVLLKRYRKAADVLIYLDPPYLPDERTQKKGYGKYEVGTDFHIDTAEMLRALPGMVVISGKPCELYAQLYEDHGWLRVDKEARANSGATKIESLWLSPNTQQALGHNFTDLPLFANGS